MAAPTTTICTDIINPGRNASTEVIIVRGYGSTDDGTYHTRTWRLLLPWRITNQSRAEAIGKRRPNFCRVIHL